LRAEVMNSDQFAQTMLNTLNSPVIPDSKRELPPTAEEVEEMLDLMTRKRKNLELTNLELTLAFMINMIYYVHITHALLV